MAAQQITCPWAKKSIPTPCSFQQVMSEQLALEFQEGLEDIEPQSFSEDSFPGQLTSGGDLPVESVAAFIVSADHGGNDTGDDEMIAHMLQHQYDREHDFQLAREASVFNGSSKLRISFENYMKITPGYEEDAGGGEEGGKCLRKTKWGDGRPEFGAKGFSGSGKNITTKHDTVLCGRKNAERLLEFPPDIEIGDGEGIDMQLPNNVYNSLKRHSMSESKRGLKHSEKKEHSTAEQVVDPRTRELLFKLISTGVLQSIGGVIAGGKESLVFQATGGSDEVGVDIPEGVAVKVFKTTLMEFRTREKYIHGDHRFSKDVYKKQNPRKIVKLWAMKEAANLNIMCKFGLPCPRVMAVKSHVLVMSLVGGSHPAPKLKDAVLTVGDVEDAYAQTVNLMSIMHGQCCLVHADLSEYNLLWHDGLVHIIDVSQAVDLSHPQAYHFLYRDCVNISVYFAKAGAHGVLTPGQLFNRVTGLSIMGEGAEFGVQLLMYIREHREMKIAFDDADMSSFNFDYFFDASQDATGCAVDSEVAQLESSHRSSITLVRECI